MRGPGLLSSGRARSTIPQVPFGVCAVPRSCRPWPKRCCAASRISKGGGDRVSQGDTHRHAVAAGHVDQVPVALGLGQSGGQPSTARPVATSAACARAAARRGAARLASGMELSDLETTAARRTGSGSRTDTRPLMSSGPKPTYATPQKANSRRLLRRQGRVAAYPLRPPHAPADRRPPYRRVNGLPDGPHSGASSGRRGVCQRP